MSDEFAAIHATLHPGPCVICGLRDYPLSMGGPTICPTCDAGYYGPALIAAQKKRIVALEAALQKIASCQKRADGDVVDIARRALPTAWTLDVPKP